LSYSMRQGLSFSLSLSLLCLLIHTHPTGWRRHIACLKWQVIFRKGATSNIAFLRQKTYKEKASYGSSPPCRKSPVQEGSKMTEFGCGVDSCYLFFGSFSTNEIRKGSQFAAEIPALLETTFAERVSYDLFMYICMHML